MSAICGIVHFNGAPVDPALLSRMTASAPHRGPDGVSFWYGDQAGLAHLAFHVTPESVRERQPLASSDHRYVLAADARIDNRGELIGTLRHDPGLPPDPTDADLILAAFLRWGEFCCERLLGDFVFAVWDTLARRLFLVCDALGGRSLCYHFDGRRCVLASEVTQILDLPGWRPRFNEAKIAEFLMSRGHEDEASFFESIHYCPAGHCLTLSADGARRRRYWDIDPDHRLRYREDREYAEHFLELITAATRCRMRSIGRVGLSLSGGLDSTLLAAVAAPLVPQLGLPQRRLKTFSYVFDELTDCDEREYIHPVVDRYELDATYLPCDDRWTLKDLSNWPVMRGYLWSDAYVGLPTAAAEAARDAGCRVLLNGQYGDALYTSGRYWATDLLRDGRFGELARAVRNYHRRIHWRDDLIKPGLRQLIPWRLKRLLRRFRALLRVREQWPAIHPDLGRRTEFARRLGNDSRECRFDAGRWTRLSSLTASYWSQGFGETRGYHNRFGLEVESPYHDRRLVEFIMALPADQLGRPWRNRWIQRNAMRDLLPASVSERESKTSFDPLMTRGLGERESETLRRILSHPLGVRYHLIDGAWLEHMLARATPDLDSLYELWLCASLELWLNAMCNFSG